MKKLNAPLLSLVFSISYFSTLSLYAQEDRTLPGASNVQTIDDGYGFDIDLSGDYLFDFDQDSLTAKAKAALRSVLKIYQQHDGFEIGISGHTDNVGSESYNQALSERRALRVYSWFLDQGIPSTSLSQAGYGETQPVANNQEGGQDNPQGRALNRRVEIRAKTRKKIEKLPTTVPPKPVVPSKPTVPSKLGMPEPTVPSKPIPPSKPSIPKPIAPSRPVPPSNGH